MKRINDYILEFDLVQQSPLMIKKEQFQNDKPAYHIFYSELVPALNRYLTQQGVKVGVKHRNQGGGYAYDFRITLSTQAVNSGFYTYERLKQGIPAEDFSGYFGWMFCRDVQANIALICEITSSCKELVDAIEKHISDFFTFQQFGGKKTKANGQFIIQGTESAYKSFLANKHATHFVLQRNVSPVPHSPLNSSYYNPNYLGNYKLIKAGKNQPYEKSKLRVIFNSVCWEKKAIKIALKNSKRNWYNDLKCTHNALACSDLKYSKSDTSDTSLPEHIRFIRPIMGLPGHFEFLKTNGGNRDKISITVTSLEESKENKIERFPSQIQFKIFGNHVFCLIPRSADNDAVRQISNKAFKFIATNNHVDHPLIDEIRTPTYSDGNLEAIKNCFIDLGWTPYAYE